MADHPILFSAPMVRALLDGRKTQTRRILKPQPIVNCAGLLVLERKGDFLQGTPDDVADAQRITTDDSLWVREAWRCNGWATDMASIFYRASEGDGYTAMCEQYPVAGKKPMRVTTTWRPGIHMPRWASRITLAVTEVRVERLQDISEADAVAEGCFKGKASGRVFANETAMHLGGDQWRNARDWYADVWDLINGEGAWDKNPWVVAYSFTVLPKNIDEVRS